MLLHLQDFVHPSWLEVLTDPVRLGLLRTLTLFGPVTVTTLAADTHTADPTVRRHLDALVTLGVVTAHQGQSDGLTRGRPATRYSLDPEARENAVVLFSLLGRPLGAATRRSQARFANR